jgi:hypothetical protein
MAGLYARVNRFEAMRRLFGRIGSWKIVLIAAIGKEYERRSQTAGAL